MAWIDLSRVANEQASSFGQNLAGCHFQNQTIICSSPTNIFIRSKDKKMFRGVYVFYATSPFLP